MGLVPDFVGGVVEGGVSAGEDEVVGVVAAADDAGDGDALVAAGLDDVVIAGGEAGVGEGEVAELVVVVGVDAGVVDHEVGFDLLEQVGEETAEGLEVVVVVDAFRQGHVEVGGDFASGEVFLAVDRAGEDAGLVGEDSGGAVALVDVEVEDKDLMGELSVQGVGGGDGEVVEDAET